MASTRLALFALVAALPARADSCFEWQQRASTGPSARWYDVLAYDSARGVTVLFGGHRGGGGGTWFGDTWEWDGAEWALSNEAGPAARYETAMAYDAAREVVVLFGGADGETTFGDTWEWDGVAWTLAATEGPGRRRHALAYDAARGVTVVYGGECDDCNEPYTWEWDGRSWTRIVPPFGPPSRQWPAMTFDSLRGVVVLFGGDGFESGYRSDTWEWNGLVWAEVAVSGPSARYGHAMVYDSSRNRTILFGGQDGLLKGDTWEWDGSVWTVASVAGPTARVYPGMAYDFNRAETVLFGGGTGDTFGADTWIVANISTEPTVISSQPQNVVVCPTESATFSVAISGTPATGFQWRRDGVALLDDVRISGATAATLTIDSVVSPDAGAYDVVVSSTCESQVSDDATLRTDIPGDLNLDGDVDLGDLGEVLSEYGCASACGADIDGDDDVDLSDLGVVLASFGRSCP